MNIKQKLQIVERDIKSISNHSDEDTSLLVAALDKIVHMVQAEKSRLASQAQQDIEAKLTK